MLPRILRSRPLPTDPAARKRGLYGLVAFVAGYIALILWFKEIDVYHRHFATAGVVGLVNNLFRIAFVGYLFFLVHGTGAIALRLIPGANLARARPLEAAVVRFYAGTGIWHIALLAVGFLNLFTVPVAVGITLPLVAISFQEVSPLIVAMRHAASRQLRALRRVRNLPLAAVSWRLAFVALALLLPLDLLATKGLYPNGGHDYYTHYFYYYQTVIDRGGLWPNDVWFHFYYSKGAGLYFLAILLTDPLAPQLVTFCFVSVAAASLFLFLKRIAPSAAWPHVGWLLFVLILIYSPTISHYRSLGGWGDFEKLHEINAALVLGIIYLAAGALDRADPARRAWVFAAASATTAAVLIHSTISVFLCGLFALTAVYLGLRARWQDATISCALAAVAGSMLVVQSTINYLATGLINDQGILRFWRFADLDKLQDWGALPMLMYMHWGTVGMTAASVPILGPFFVLLARALRVDLLLPLVLGGVWVVAAAMRKRPITIPTGNQPLVLVAGLLVFCGIALVFGREQAVSFFRYSSFALPMTIALAVTMWHLSGQGERSRARSARNRLGALAVIVACLPFATFPVVSFFKVQGQAWRFFLGLSSIDAAYTHQSGWPGRLAWGAIHPGARGAYEAVGAGTRIWSMHIHSYCMLPNCRIESFPSFILTPDWDRLMFGTPEEGRELLRRSGHNYFLFSKGIARKLHIVDALPLSPLFAPDNISRYLGIAWTDGDTSLLTWLGPGVAPLDAAWVAEYRRAVESSTTVTSFPLEAMRQVYAKLRATPHPWRSFPLPWYRP